MNEEILIRPRHLIISSSIDYSTDYICLELSRRNALYLRLNRDQFSEYEILYSVDENCLKLKTDGREYIIEKDLGSIYYRAPVFIRSHKQYSVEEQLYRSQWSSFLRNLIIFDRARWMNHPVETYRAENKLYQLDIAQQIGLEIPQTYVGNGIPEYIDDKKKYVVKSLDTALFYDGDQEMFTYTTIVSGKELKELSLRAAPIILQEYIEEKIDLRVTYVAGRIFPAKIVVNNEGIIGDWRKKSKDELAYIPIDLPIFIENKLSEYMKRMNLNFGGVDFVYAKGKYYFVEVNPTGEWSWLLNTAHFPIDRAIVDFMEGINGT